MGNIYESAEDVIAWLGPPEKSCYEAFDFISHLGVRAPDQVQIWGGNHASGFAESLTGRGYGYFNKSFALVRSR
jgi:hypothetical protein